jgi:acyl-CoA synthetase (AMP-forming)/AMP-acid ligase II
VIYTVVGFPRRPRMAAPWRIGGGLAVRRWMAEACWLDGRRRSRTASAEQVAALIYTTGTTGNPKGVMLSAPQPAVHRGRIQHAARPDAGRPRLGRAADLPRLRPGLGHAGHPVCGRLPVPVPALHADALLKAIRDDHLTILQGVPAMYARLLETLGDAATPLASQLRFAYAGGSPLSPASRPRPKSCSACRCTTATA